MDKNIRTAVAGVMGFLFVASTVSTYRSETKKTKQMVAKINADMNAEIEATHIASAIVQDRLANGYYNGKSLADVMNDFEFETIIHRP